MKKTLIIGASTNEERYSNKLAKKLKLHDIPFVLVGRREGSVEEEPIHVTKDSFEGIHTVSLYINPTHQKEYYEYILSLKPQRVIFNPGTENDSFKTMLESNRIATEYSCSLVLLSLNSY